MLDKATAQGGLSPPPEREAMSSTLPLPHQPGKAAQTSRAKPQGRQTHTAVRSSR